MAIIASPSILARERRSAGDSFSRVMTSVRMTTESVSTMNWVKARSGAPNERKIRASAKPWMPSETMAVSRSRAAMTAASPTTAMRNIASSCQEFGSANRASRGIRHRPRAGSAG